MTDNDSRVHFPMGESYGNHPMDGKYPGKLIIVEGIDGSGKSTQIDLLGKWLKKLGYVTIFTEWNSSPIVKRTTKMGKRERMLTPMSFSMIHAADFANRVHTQVIPALKSGTIVLADRYVYTAFARDTARGVNRDWLRRVYAFAIKPSLAFYFKVPLEESIRRIVTGRDQLGFYESGQDLGLSESRTESFRQFQGNLLQEYDRLTDEFGLIAIDATQTIAVQQQQVRDHVETMLNGIMQFDSHTVPEALASSGLTGRYLAARGLPSALRPDPNRRLGFSHGGLAHEST